MRLWKGVQAGLVCSVSLALPGEILAADWPHFRGWHGGQAESARPLPVEIGPDRHVLWKVPLAPGHSSPVVFGDRIFVTAAEDSWQVLHSSDFGEAGYATPAIVDGRIYLRTNQHLYCIGLPERNG